MKLTSEDVRRGADALSRATPSRTGRCGLAASLALALGLAWPGGARTQPSAAERAQAAETVPEMDRRIEELQREIDGSKRSIDRLDRELAAETAHIDRLHGEWYRLALRFRERYRSEHELLQVKRRLTAQMHMLLRQFTGPTATAREGSVAAEVRRRIAELQAEVAALEAVAPTGLAQRLLGGQQVRLRPDGVMVAVPAGTGSDVDSARLPRPAPSGDQVIGEAERGIVVDLLQSWSGLANEERGIGPLVAALNRDAQGLGACVLDHPSGGGRVRVSVGPTYAPTFMVDRHRILRLRMRAQPQGQAGSVGIETFVPLAAVQRVELERRPGTDCWTVNITCTAAAGDCGQVAVSGQDVQAVGTLTLHLPGGTFATRAAELLGALANAASRQPAVPPVPATAPAR